MIFKSFQEINNVNKLNFVTILKSFRKINNVNKNSQKKMIWIDTNYFKRGKILSKHLETSHLGLEKQLAPELLEMGRCLLLLYAG